MDPFHTCEILLSYVRKSNLNFSLYESPFSVSLSIKKAFIKHQNGSVRSSKLSEISQPDSHLLDKNQVIVQENESLKADVIQHKLENEALLTMIEDLNVKLQKAKDELTGIMSEKNNLEKAKKVVEGELDEKVTELIEIKNFSTKVKRENENLESKGKALSTKLKAKEKELKEIKLENENIRESLESAKSEVETLETLRNESDKMEAIKYNVETNNNFKVLADPRIEIPHCEQNALVKDDNPAALKPDKILHHNYKEALKDFLDNYKEGSSELPKYRVVATEMMNKHHNMFHMSLQDIRQFNPNLGGFIAAQYRNLDAEITAIVKKFIEDQDLGVFQNGLYFNLDRIRNK